MTTVKKKEHPAINWCFRKSAKVTDPKDEDAVEAEAAKIYAKLIDCCDAIAFQLESAPETGYLHYQGFFALTNKKRFSWILKNTTNFEYLRNMKGRVHQAWAYAIKDETRVAGPWILGECPSYGNKKPDTTYQDALAAPTVKEGLAIVKANKPRDFCLYGATIERNLNANLKKPFIHKYMLEDFLHAEMDLKDKSTVLYGPSNTGKTSFAIAHFKNPLVISHMDGLSKLNSDHDGIVFDDLSFLHWPPESVIQLVDQELDRDIHIRYRTATIPANTPRVFTHNTRDIFYKPEIGEEQKKAIDRRVNYCNIPNKLFGKKEEEPIPDEYAEFSAHEENEI